MAKPSIQKQFRSFHKANPHVYRLFRKYARQARRAGHKRYSADALLHVIRWHLFVVTKADPAGAYKINNNYSSRYARMMVKKNPSFKGFFEMRVLKRK